MKHGNSESILSKYSIYASTDDNKIQLNKKQLIKAIRYGDIDCSNDLFALEDFTRLLKDFYEDHKHHGLSFFFLLFILKKIQD